MLGMGPWPPSEGLQPAHVSLLRSKNGREVLLLDDGVRVLEPRKNAWLADTCTLDTAGCRLLPCADSTEACLVVITTTVVGCGKLQLHVLLFDLNMLGLSLVFCVFDHRMFGRAGTLANCAAFEATLLFFQFRLLVKSISTLVFLDGISKEAISHRPGNSEETSDGQGCD